MLPALIWSGTSELTYHDQRKKTTRSARQEEPTMARTAVMFLDIDGVLNQHAHCHAYREPKIDWKCCRALNYILALEQWEVVIISTWAQKIVEGEWSHRGFASMLATHGLDRINIIDNVDPRIIAVNQDRRFAERTQKVRQYVEDHLKAGEAWLALDDMGLKIHQNNHIRPAPGVGLEFRHITEAREKLALQREAK